jgi:predicted ATPase
MKIKTIEIHNFKSYKKLHIDLDQFNVLIGPNAAGKSNFIQSLKFFRDIVNEGLDNAISLQGGISFLRNINTNSSEKNISFRIVFSPDKNFKFFNKKNNINYEFQIKEFDYSFSLHINEKSVYKVRNDKLIQLYDFFKSDDSNKSKSKNKFICSGKFTITKNSDIFKFGFQKNKSVPFTPAELRRSLFIGFEDFTIEKRLLRGSELRKSLLFETPLYFMPHIETLKRDFGRLAIYDIDTRQSKMSASIAGKADLEENAENLALVLKRILADRENKRKFLNLLNYLLPFIENLEVESILDKYLQIAVKEKYSGDKFIPGFLLSEGTIFILAIIIAMYFEDRHLVIFEEPERRIHPNLISKIIDMMKDASTSKQIILSTHNPEIVKYAGIENISFISRDKNGFSTIIKPREKEEIRTFLENEIGIEDLFVQNLLS